ncbi:PREDICTED: chromo domain-containing protein LHP1-like isoform X2 [Nelumbo nucifera]|uniref:Chromo domain-containing protein LHP1-like isoform X2 n=2 Tax=Nelumbo nucifera TaxID=4432 RepID=A0A1U7ZRT1_NELNU|nr:PREDICTED: chromo domain-containing protein LHP1-like isoform X2 [Nelumbo nucifera]DAD43299.1 TPA_asm: hypothetical protein HUJ06_001529 [Nelumbo nucifera]
MGGKKKSDLTQQQNEEGNTAIGGSAGGDGDGAAAPAEPQDEAVAGVVEQEEEENDEEVEEEEEGGEEGAKGGVEAERPKLADGFYEIEDVRRKRVRKGQTQYLIKWRGWPETANTWEPLENLQSCSDVIEAFEERSRSSRKRKRKYGGPHTQPKRKQRVGVLPGLKFSGEPPPLPSDPLNKSNLGSPTPPAADGTEAGETSQGKHSRDEGKKQGDAMNVAGTERPTNNGSANISIEPKLNKEVNEADPKLSELKGTMPPDEANARKLSISFSDTKNTEEDDLMNGISKVESVEPAQSSRFTGAKKRKSGSVRRFKQDSASGEPDDAQNPMARSTLESRDRVEPPGMDDAESMGDDVGNKNKLDDSTNPYSITKIIKPIGYSASILNDTQDVLVTFLAMRSDGKEVVVDSKFLKTNNPLLLISFYEQHLRYTPT